MKIFISVLLIYIFTLFNSNLYSQYLNLDDTLKSNYKLIDKLTPDIIKFSKSINKTYKSNGIDSLILNKRQFANLDSNCILIGKLIDSTTTFAVLYSSNDSLLTFYRFSNFKWVITNSFKEDWGSLIDSRDLDGDSINEITYSTFRNMNGNSWSNIYKYNFKSQIFHFAGDYCCLDSIDLKNKTIYEYHTGSWYMDNYRTKYQWINDTLVPIYHVRLEPNIKRLKNIERRVLFDYWISFYTNPEKKYNSKYKLEFKSIYREKKHEKYFENFKNLDY